jgi:hypothetical protein
MYDLKKAAEANTSSVGIAWVSMTEADRVGKVNELLETSEFRHELEVQSALDDGQVIVQLLRTLSSSERGTLLLDFEGLLKDKIDKGICVWVAAIGDKNSLRKLRGVTVK